MGLGWAVRSGGGRAELRSHEGGSGLPSLLGILSTPPLSAQCASYPIGGGVFGISTSWVFVDYRVLSPCRWLLPPQALNAYYLPNKNQMGTGTHRPAFKLASLLLLPFIPSPSSRGLRAVHLASHPPPISPSSQRSCKVGSAARW